MKILLVTGAVFVIVNVSFFFLQLGHHTTETACDCARKSDKANVASSEAFGAAKKPVFHEVIKPAYNDRVKEKKYNDASNIDSAVPKVQSYFWNETYKPVLLHSSSHKLAVVVPFRNRYEEMMEFVPHMHKFLTRQNISHQIWIVSQVDTHRYGDRVPSKVDVNLLRYTHTACGTPSL